MRVEFFRHNLNEEDLAAATGTLRSIFLTTGPRVAEFEERFSKYLHAPHTVGVTSCTAAMHLALLAFGVGEGDEVVTTPMTFCATANAILHTGAEPVFVDVEDDTGNLDASLVEAAITERTKAILPVHLYGQMVDMRELRRIADEHGLVLIEDAAHCVEGERDGVRPAQLSDAACFSFYATKNLACGEGGAVVVNDEETAALLRRLRSHGIDAVAADRYTKAYHHWDMRDLGWKYNMDDIHASLMVNQIGRLDGYWERRDSIWRRYEEAFADVEGVRTTATRPGSRHARHAFTIQVAPGRRDEVIAELQGREIGVAVNFRAVHLLDYYRRRYGYEPGTFPFAERIGASTVTLPLYPSLTEEQQRYVIDNVRDVLSGEVIDAA